jgi:1,4-alpha-glucan branching enzyme
VGAAAAAVVVALFLGRQQTPVPVEGPPEDVVVYVQFALDAPDAQSVAVAGDFDGWKGMNALEDLDGDGIWTGRVAIRPGVHAYMFLVNGSTWTTDPRAQRYAEDGFGNRNAILAVAAPSAPTAPSA